MHDITLDDSSWSMVELAQAMAQACDTMWVNIAREVIETTREKDGSTTIETRESI